MVDILCPHCEEEIELEDDVSGEFACPYCEDEFEWNIQHEVQQSEEASSLLFAGIFLLMGMLQLCLGHVGFIFNSLAWEGVGVGSHVLAAVAFLMTVATGIGGFIFLWFAVKNVLWRISRFMQPLSQR